MGPVIQSGSGVFPGSVRSKVAVGISRQLYCKWVLRDPGSFCAMVQLSFTPGFQAHLGCLQQAGGRGTTTGLHAWWSGSGAYLWKVTV